MPFLAMKDSTKIYYEEQGRGKETLLFAHGLNSSHLFIMVQAIFLYYYFLVIQVFQVLIFYMVEVLIIFYYFQLQEWDYYRQQY